MVSVNPSTGESTAAAVTTRVLVRTQFDSGSLAPAASSEEVRDFQQWYQEDPDGPAHDGGDFSPIAGMKEEK